MSSSGRIWLKKNEHWIGPLGILIGLAGLIASAYFFFSTREVGEITLKFTTVKIADASVPSIRISDARNNPITSNVFGCQIVIWNTGNLSLGEKSDRIRQPVTITFSDDVRIIDAVVQDVKNVPANAIKLEQQSNRISILWTQFDPDDAIKVFVIYASNTQSGIEYEGRFLRTRLSDLTEFKEEYPTGSAGLAALRYDFARKPVRMTVFALSIISQIVIFGLVLTVDRFRRWDKAPKVTILVVMAASAVMVVVLMLEQFTGRVPFS